MAKDTVAYLTRYPSALFDFDWTQSERPEVLASGLYLTTRLLDLAYAGHRALEEKIGTETEETGRELLGALVSLAAIGAHQLAERAGVLPSQQDGAA